MHRGCIVAERAIDRTADRIYLVNGEGLTYTVRNKKEIVEKLRINPKNRIKIPVRGVYQIMNPDAFDGVVRENEPTNADEKRTDILPICIKKGKTALP